MTVVYCDQNPEHNNLSPCRYNKDGKCTRKELTLKTEHHIECQDYKVDSDFQRKEWEKMMKRRKSGKA